MSYSENDREFPPGNSSDRASALRALCAEPPAGFEARLMERLAAAPRPRRFHSGVTALALCAALASAIALIVIVRSPQPPPASPSRRAAARAIAPVQPRLALHAATWRGPERSGPPLPTVEAGPQPRPTGAASRKWAAPPQSVRTARVAVVLRPLPRRRPRLRAAIRRFPAQFPTPTPPTASELALLRFVRTAPPAVVAAFAAAPDLQPIKIAAIEIKPLSQSPQGETEP
ncbi:MAG: hypothetical protein ACRD2H_11240 [Terriglobales bacterium]